MPNGHLGQEYVNPQKITNINARKKYLWSYSKSYYISFEEYNTWKQLEIKGKPMKRQFIILVIPSSPNFPRYP